MSKELNSRIAFSLSPVGDVEIQPINPTLSKARVSIFYTGLNRNLTYISKEFADKLLATLPYTPIGGLWNKEDKDFEDHGTDREEFVAYGVVPENPNLQWEDHLDKDGILRNYACCDVFLWTARYEAARAMPGKSESMELYLDSVKGEWKRDGALEYFEFTDGCFLGLTALGKDVEPCFEGAAIYNLDDANNLIKELKQYNFSATNEIIGGTDTMDEEKIVDEVQEEPVVENEAENVEPETEEVVETEVEETEEEHENPDDGEPAEGEEVEGEEPTEEPTEEGEDEGIEATETENFQSLYENAQARIKELETQIGEYQSQIQELTSYKANNERVKKEELISKYSEVLPQEKIDELTENIENYTLDSLKSEIALAVVSANEDTLFNKTTETVIIKDVETKKYTGAAKLMAEYYGE